MKNLIMMSSLLLVSIACSKNDDRMKKKAAIESESSTASQVKVENENLANKSQQMERDLARRQRFYQALKGIYEGNINTADTTYSIRITLTPSLSPTLINRVRQLEEVTADLNNLMIHAQVQQWDPTSNSTAVGCRISNIRPDIEKGTLAISSDSCPNLYNIKVTERGFVGPGNENTTTATRIARQLLDGDLREIDSIVGTIQPSTNASIFKFVALKVGE